MQKMSRVQEATTGQLQHTNNAADIHKNILSQRVQENPKSINPEVCVV